MKRIILLMAFILFFVAGPANAVMIDFDSLAPGTYSESEFSDLFEGVSFDNNGGSFNVVGDSSNYYINDYYGGQRQDIIRFEPYLSTVATFDNLTDYVSITNLCDMPHAVMFSMRIFDTDHNLLSQVSDIYSPTDPFFPLSSYVLEYESDLANIASVEFWSDDFNYTQGDGYWDNFTFNDAQPIPEPATILMLSFGLVGLIGKRKFFQEA